MHDSAIAVVSPEGAPIFAVSLERISRIKQDGRTLKALLSGVPWDRIRKVAISAPEHIHVAGASGSKVLPTRLASPRKAETLVHGDGFHEALKIIPCEKIFVGHQDAHAASAFWGSGFEEALCFTYDGGMSNDTWFGGLYRCSRSAGVQPLEQFDALQYAKVTTLYTFVTALLGFMPLRHEGKITGLAAYGTATERCLQLLQKWFEQEYSQIEETMYWVNCYDNNAVPQLVPSNSKLERFRLEIAGISKEELAASVQDFAEKHVIQIIRKAKELGWVGANICLAGGLFANVKINQRVAELGFESLFVAPPMTDDGTALGAAWHVNAGSPSFRPKTLHSMFLGPRFADDSAVRLIRDEHIRFSCPANLASVIAELLSQGKIVAVFQGAAEFGPRALGNRSILAQATKSDINQSLNERLNRTEFMPFAPMTREEDAEDCYFDIGRVKHAAEFMTVTVNCKDIMRQKGAASVHIDGTARPQLIVKQHHPLIHDVLTAYKGLTGNPSIVNTSFNVHEEPIVCSPKDALRGFFESALDYLYLEGVGLISYEENISVAIKYLNEKAKRKSQKEIANESLVEFIDRALVERTEWLEKAGRDLQERTQELVETRQVLVDRTKLLEVTSVDLRTRTQELVETRQVPADRTKLLEATSVDLRTRTQELVETRQVLADRTNQLEVTSTDLRMCTQELEETRQVLAGRTNQLEVANGDIRMRTQELLEARQMLADQTKQLEVTSYELQARTEEIEEFISSPLLKRIFIKRK